MVIQDTRPTATAYAIVGRSLQANPQVALNPAGAAPLPARSAAEVGLNSFRAAQLAQRHGCLAIDAVVQPVDGFFHCDVNDIPTIRQCMPAWEVRLR